MFYDWRSILDETLGDLSTPIFRLELEDCATPSIDTFTKEYFGTLLDINNFVSALEWDSGEALPKLELTPASVLGLGSSDTDAYTAMHQNIWGYSYEMSSESVECYHVWLECEGKFLRCVKARFLNLTYRGEEPDLPTLPVTMIWGPDHLIEQSGKFIFNRLFEVEKQFDTREELQGDLEAFDGLPVFTEFFNDIFADG